MGEVIVSRRDLTSFYGVVEAGDFLPEVIGNEIVHRVAASYLAQTESIARGQFLYLVSELSDWEIQRLHLPIASLRSIRSARRYWQQEIPETEIRMSEATYYAYSRMKEKVYPHTPKLSDFEPNSLIHFIVDGFKRLSSAIASNNSGTIAVAVDYINWLCHSEGQLITWVDEYIESDEDRYAAYTYTLVHSSVYQPEALRYIYRDVRKALREKARWYGAQGIDLYNRERFVNAFVACLENIDQFTAEEAIMEIDSPRLTQEVQPRLKKQFPYAFSK